MSDNKEKLNENMILRDIIITMSNGNPGAINVITQMITDDFNKIADILFLDDLNIRGAQIYMLWSDCSNKNMEKYYRTLAMLKDGIFTEKQINDNLGLYYAIPFIDDEISPEGTPIYGEEFGPSHPLWQEFCEIQKKAFTKKLEEELAAQQTYSKKAH